MMLRLKRVVMLMPKKKYVETTIALSKQWPCFAVDPTVKQEQINQALAELSRAEGKLNGKQLIFQALKIHQGRIEVPRKNAEIHLCLEMKKRSYLVAFKGCTNYPFNPGAK